MSAIDEIVDMRRKHPEHDEELWEHMSKVYGRNLVNLSNEELQHRLYTINRNIQYLDNGSTLRDHLGADRGWISPWWWFRARYWTLLEFDQRSLMPKETDDLPPMPSLRPGLQGVVAGGRPLLIRISRIEWLLATLVKGSLRFTPASIYRDPTLDAARGDDELSKTYRRPAQAIEISSLDGRRIEAVGDVRFAARRAIVSNAELIDVPYWLLSFSSDLDPRLFHEFEHTNPNDHGCIVIFDPHEFVVRALPALNRKVPWAVKSLFPTVYFDPHYVNFELNALSSKEFGFACQREMRFVLDPEGQKTSIENLPICVDIGSLADIAGVYSCSGHKLAGVGPDFFLA